MFKKERKQCYLGIGLSVVVFIIGEILLDYVAQLEKPPGGTTVYIVIGSSLLFVAAILAFYSIRRLMYLKKKEKRKKKSRVYFLEGNQPKSRRTKSE